MTKGRGFYVNRRSVLRAAAIGLATPSLSGRVEAQTRKVPAVGFLTAASANASYSPELRSRLQALGYVDGPSLRFIERHGDGTSDVAALSRLAIELLQEGVDVIVTEGRLATRATRRVTNRIPIVMGGVGDADEFVSDLSCPSENITGFVLRQDKTDVKLVEILREAAPHLSKLAIIFGGVLSYQQAIAEAARAIGVDTFAVQVAGRDDLKRAFESIAAQDANGLLKINNPTLSSFRDEFVSLAREHRLPAVSSQRGFARAGFLAAYQPDFTHLIRSTARYVDLLIKGAKVANLPVQEPTRFNLFLNLKTATQLGLSIPPTLLVSAEEVIE